MIQLQNETAKITQEAKEAREAEAKAREVEAKAREAEAKAREAEAKAREAEAEATKEKNEAVSEAEEAREAEAKAKADAQQANVIAKENDKSLRKAVENAKGLTARQLFLDMYENVFLKYVRQEEGTSISNDTDSQQQNLINVQIPGACPEEADVKGAFGYDLIDGPTATVTKDGQNIADPIQKFQNDFALPSVYFDSDEAKKKWAEAFQKLVKTRTETKALVDAVVALATGKDVKNCYDVLKQTTYLPDKKRAIEAMDAYMEPSKKTKKRRVQK